MNVKTTFSDNFSEAYVSHSEGFEVNARKMVYKLKRSLLVLRRV